MHILRPATWQADFKALPADIKLAWLGDGIVRPSLFRLTETHWAFRPEVGQGATYIIDTQELIPYLMGLRWPSPYQSKDTSK